MYLLGATECSGHVREDTGNATSPAANPAAVSE